MNNRMESCKTFVYDAIKIEEIKRKLPGEDTLLDLSDFFDAMGNPTRLKILYALMHGELCTCDLSILTGVSVSAISHQLRILKDRRIIRYRKDGRNVYYRLDDEHIMGILKTALTHKGD